MTSTERDRDAFDQTLFNAVLAPIIVIAADGTIRYANQTAEEFFGYQLSGGLQGRPLHDIIPHSAREQHESPVRAYFECPTIRVLGHVSALVGLHRQGHRIPIDIALKPLQTADEELCVAVISDRREHDQLTSQLVNCESELRERELALREYEERYRTLAALSPVGIFYTDAKGDCLDVNERWCEITGLTIEHALGDQWQQALHPDDLTRTSSAWYDAARNNTPFQLEYRIQRPDRVVKWVYGQALPRRDAHGQVIGYVGAITDITDHKRVAAEAREAARLLEIFFQFTQTQLAFLDKDYNFIRVNSAYAAADRREASEYPGRNHFDLYPSDALEFFDRVRTTKMPFHAFSRPFVFAHNPERGVTHWDVTLAPILDERDEISMLVLSMNDVTERERTVQALHEAEKHLLTAQRLESIGRLASGVAHDFNNMLMAIMGHAKFLEKGLAEDHPLRMDAQQISMAARRLASLTQKLLAFSRQQFLQMRVFDIRDVIEQLDPLLRRLLHANIDYVFESGAERGRVRTDRGQFEHVLVNLMLNARDAMPDGGRITISLGSQTLTADGERDLPAGEYVTMAITDTGHGIPTDILDRIFDPYFTTKPLGQGTGLGLSMAFGTVRQSSGTMHVDSMLGQGSTFEILLPRVDAPVEHTAESYHEVSRLQGEETILLIEDDDMIREVLRTALHENGYNVLVASSGAEALAHHESFDGPIHLCLSDVVLPGMSGWAVLQRLQQTRPEMQCIFMSGHAATPQRDKSGAPAGAYYLHKPFTPEEALRPIRRLLDAARDE